MKKVISIALALLIVAVMLPVKAMADESTVAKLTIGETVTEYDSLVDAVKAAINKTDAKIDVLKSSSGDGIEVKHPKKLDLTIDFHGYTYDVSGKAVGSKGYESQAWHIEKESKLTLMNGTLEASSKSVAMLFQNYSNLTLDNMVLNAQKTGFAYVMSNNNGDVVIKDTTIFAAAGMVAFDVCRYADYVGPMVTVKGNSVINGKVEISSSGAKDGAQHELVIENGTFNGAIESVGASPNFTSTISGGTFNSDVTSYLGIEVLYVTDSNNYYVGDAAKNAVQNAPSGTFTVLKVGRDANFNDVNPGVTVNNGTDNGRVTVNGNEVPNDRPYTVPGAPIIIYTPDNEPAILSGANQVVAPGAAATFRIDEEYDRLLAVAVDGVTLDKSNYEAWSGSTYIKLLPKFMKTLSVGTHTLTAYFTSHTVSTTFTISEGAKNPATGANDFVGVAAAMAVVSLLGAAAVIRKK